jgi:hypothetical protein
MRAGLKRGMRCNNCMRPGRPTCGMRSAYRRAILTCLRALRSLQRLRMRACVSVRCVICMHNVRALPCDSLLCWTCRGDIGLDDAARACLHAIKDIFRAPVIYMRYHVAYVTVRCNLQGKKHALPSWVNVRATCRPDCCEMHMRCVM